MSKMKRLANNTGDKGRGLNDFGKQNRYGIGFIVRAAMIAALYVLVTWMLAPVSFGGPLQFRLAESLMVLPALLVEAVPGLFIGCLLANILNPGNLGPADIILGSFATLIAAVWTVYLGKSSRERMARLGPERSLRNIIFRSRDWLLPLPAIILNGIIVGTYLPFLLNPGQIITWELILLSIGGIMLSEAAVIYIFGIPLYVGLYRAGICERPDRSPTVW